LELVERIFTPEEAIYDVKLALYLVFSGFILNLISAILLSKYSQMRLTKERQNGGREDYKHSAYHIIADTISSLSVIIALFLSIDSIFWDSVASLVIIILMLCEAYPLCKETGKMLLQTTPSSIRDSLDKCLREASTVEGVLECCNEHFWTQAPGAFIGTLTVKVRSDANEQLVLAKVTNIFSHLITNLTVQVEKEDWVLPNSS